jgi:transcriptional regulator with XRE-family HTH domain
MQLDFSSMTKFIGSNRIARTHGAIGGIHGIGRHLRRCRERRGLTQTVLARNLGFTYQQLQKYELGINRISLPTVLRLLKVLEITPIQFMESLSDDLGNLVERPGTLALSPTAFR